MSRSAVGGMSQRAAFIPLRLSEDERSLLRVLEGALAVSEYTDKVDILSYRNDKAARVQEQLGNVLAAVSGMVVAALGNRGQQLVQGRTLPENFDLFCAVFEVGRRYKVMNPDKMRSTYGKLMHMLQDAQSTEIQHAIGFRVVRAMLTVRRELEDMSATELLEDADLEAAVRAVLPGESAEAKREATTRLVAKYGGGDAAACARIERVLVSLADDEALTLAHVAPVERMLQLLHEEFDPSSAEMGVSLAISAGRQGARLTHSHEMQFAYVEQSLRLWGAILSQLPQMWSLAEADLLDGGGYRLRDTGQGIHRVQAAPHVGRFMHHVLSRLQSQCKGDWVGSSAVHLGDNDVPNALVWIDKYTQIPRILEPLLACIDGLERLADAPGMLAYIEGGWGDVRSLRKAILGDFFRHAFDGSGADNFYDAGSCIDGRLTSAWNWCSKLPKKNYQHIFKMTGFVGFDGEFTK